MLYRLSAIAAAAYARELSTSLSPSWSCQFLFCQSLGCVQACLIIARVQLLGTPRLIVCFDIRRCWMSWWLGLSWMSLGRLWPCAVVGIWRFTDVDVHKVMVRCVVPTLSAWEHVFDIVIMGIKLKKKCWWMMGLFIIRAYGVSLLVNFEDLPLFYFGYSSYRSGFLLQTCYLYILLCIVIFTIEKGMRSN